MDAEVWQLLTVAELIMGLMLLTFFLVFVLTFTSASNFNKEYLEKDISLTALSVLSSPGDAQFKYPVKNSYELTIKDNAVSVIPNSRFALFDKTYNVTFASSPATGLRVSKDVL